MHTKLWYLMIGHIAMHWLSPFSGVARLRNLGRHGSFNESYVLYREPETKQNALPFG